MKNINKIFSLFVIAGIMVGTVSVSQANALSCAQFSPSIARVKSVAVQESFPATAVIGRSRVQDFNDTSRQGEINLDFYATEVNKFINQTIDAPSQSDVIVPQSQDMQVSFSLGRAGFESNFDVNVGDVVVNFNAGSVCPGGGVAIYTSSGQLKFVSVNTNQISGDQDAPTAVESKIVLKGARYTLSSDAEVVRFGGPASMLQETFSETNGATLTTPIGTFYVSEVALREAGDAYIWGTDSSMDYILDVRKGLDVPTGNNNGSGTVTNPDDVVDLLPAGAPRPTKSLTTMTRQEKFAYIIEVIVWYLHSKN